MAALPRFAMLHIIKPQDFWNSVLRTDKGFGHAQHLIWWKPNSISAKHLIATVKHGGGGMLIGHHQSLRPWTTL